MKVPVENICRYAYIVHNVEMYIYNMYVQYIYVKVFVFIFICQYNTQTQDIIINFSTWSLIRIG